RSDQYGQMQHAFELASTLLTCFDVPAHTTILGEKVHFPTKCLFPRRNRYARRTAGAAQHYPRTTLPRAAATGIIAAMRQRGRPSHCRSRRGFARTAVRSPDGAAGTGCRTAAAPADSVHVRAK